MIKDGLIVARAKLDLKIMKADSVTLPTVRWMFGGIAGLRLGRRNAPSTFAPDRVAPLTCLLPLTHTQILNG